MGKISVSMCGWRDSIDNAEKLSEYALYDAASADIHQRRHAASRTDVNGREGSLPWSNATRIAFGAAVLAGLVLRLYALDLRAVHHDEAVNWYFTGRWTSGLFQYDPSNYHGPALFALLGLVRLLGDFGEWSLRVPVALISASLPLCLLPMRRGLGTQGLIVAAWLLALSPTLTWIGRYAIHETLLIASTLAAVAAFWRAYTECRARAWRYGWLAIALAFATKETAFVGLGAAAMGALVAWRLQRAFPASITQVSRDLCGSSWQTSRARGLALVLALAVLIALFTNGGGHPQGIVDFFRAFALWSHTGAAGAGHEKAWWYYIDLLARYEPVALAFGVLAIPAALRREPLAVLATIWFALVFAAYTVTPYKTPWLVANLTLPLVLMAACGAQWMTIRTPRLSVALLILACVLSAVLNLRLNLLRYEAADEPMVYVQHQRIVRDFAARIRALAAVLPASTIGRVAVCSEQQWPLPFYLRGLEGVAYHTHCDETVAANVIASDELASYAPSSDWVALDDYELRPGQRWRLYLRNDVGGTSPVSRRH